MARRVDLNERPGKAPAEVGALTRKPRPAGSAAARFNDEDVASMGARSAGPPSQSPPSEASTQRMASHHSPGPCDIAMRTASHLLRVLATAAASQHMTAALEAFVQAHDRVYEYTDPVYSEIMTHVAAKPLAAIHSASTHGLYVLQTLRVLLRSPGLQLEFVQVSPGPLVNLVHILEQRVDSLYCVDAPSPQLDLDMLIEATSMVRRLVDCAASHDQLVALQVHRSLVLLLYCQSAPVLHSVLVALITLCSSNAPLAAELEQFNCLDQLVRMIDTYDDALRHLAAELMLWLAAASVAVRHQLRDTGGIAVLLRQIASCQQQPRQRGPLLRLLLSVVLSLSKERENAQEIRLLGGVPVLLSLLSPQVNLAPTDAPSVWIGVAGLLSRLARDDDTAHQIRLDNGVFLLASLLLHRSDRLLPCPTLPRPRPAPATASGTGTGAGAVSPTTNARSAAAFASTMVKGEAPEAVMRRTVAAHVLKALRHVHTVARNRRVFRRLFPSGFLQQFMDIGNFQDDIGPYVRLAEAATPDVLQHLKHALPAIDMFSLASKQVIGGYVVHEVLGQGGFGRVYLVTPQSLVTPARQFLAMKELPIDTMFRSADSQSSDKESSGDWSIMARNGAAGNNSGTSGRSSSGQTAGDTWIEAMNDEVAILRRLEHRNIISYYSSFTEDRSMYILMEHVDGTSLADLVTSTAERSQRLADAEIWDILCQMCMALRYLHVEVGVVHRDLTPNNILLDSDQQVKLVDFGLARGFHSSSGGKAMMYSVVGTIIYMCPEAVQGEQYTCKADIWSLGCVLYTLIMLRPPFAASNMLATAQRIVEAQYERIPADRVSLRLRRIVEACLTPSPTDRPDIDQIAEMAGPELLMRLYQAQTAHASVAHRLAKEQQSHDRYVQHAAVYRNEFERLVTQHRTKHDADTATAAAAAAASASPPVPGSGNSSGTMTSTGSRHSTMISMASERLRQVRDPVSQMMHQVHKLIWTMLQRPELDNNTDAAANRRVLDSFLRALAAAPPSVMKTEVSKLMAASPDTVPLPGFDHGILSYGQVQRILLDVCAASGQYPGDVTPPATHHDSAVAGASSDAVPSSPALSDRRNRRRHRRSRSVGDVGLTRASRDASKRAVAQRYDTLVEQDEP